ncbi:hypothetical protein CU254_42465 (plasmid) [Amycolatopsis sp. AA4]|nr:hypothetical protein CU254_42465 [Amycolatopsis sp. AA4]EFL12689.1 predicted protein [Streptomyces sp. AA4]
MIDTLPRMASDLPALAAEPDVTTTLYDLGDGEVRIEVEFADGTAVAVVGQEEDAMREAFVFVEIGMDVAECVLGRPLPDTVPSMASDLAIAEATEAAAQRLGLAPGEVVDGVVRRIKAAHELDHLPPAAIAQALGDTFDAGSPFRQLPFIEYVISQLPQP